VGSSTQVGGREVPIESGDVVAVTFAAGRGGAREAGEWEFWTAVAPKLGTTTARCRAAADPGERFRKMQGAPGYEKAWEVASEAHAIRPATLDETLAWLNSHWADAQYARTCRLGNSPLHMSQNSREFMFVRTPGNGGTQ